uniref:Carbohydrate deacetylase n=1 Tax=Cynoglossus semilaevis TaxID=244447 RepID=A0A3P8WMB3_CYNSE
MPQPRVMLVMTGDNFGYCPRTVPWDSEAFCYDKKHYLIEMTMTFTFFPSLQTSSIFFSLRHNIPIGLHANLSEGIPMCQSKKQVSTLLTNVVFSMDWFPSGSGARPAQHEKGLFHCFPSQVELELGAQHVHVLSPFDSFVCVCEVFAQPGLHSCLWLSLGFYTVEKNALDAIPVFSRYSIACVCVRAPLGDFKNVISCKQSVTIGYLCGATTGLVVHPGYSSHPQQGGCGEGPDDFSQSADRQHELSMLTNPASAFKELVSRNAFKERRNKVS